MKMDVHRHRAYRPPSHPPHCPTHQLASRQMQQNYQRSLNNFFLEKKNQSEDDEKLFFFTSCSHFLYLKISKF
jgi:hypothetical protein